MNHTFRHIADWIAGALMDRGVAPGPWLDIVYDMRLYWVGLLAWIALSLLAVVFVVIRLRQDPPRPIPRREWVGRDN